MAIPAMMFIEKLRIHAVKLPHTEGKVAFRRLDKEMVMVGHETIGVADPIISLIDMLNSVEEDIPIIVILEDRLLLIPSGGHMVDGAGVFYAERAGHEARIADKRAICNKRDLTLGSPLGSPV